MSDFVVRSLLLSAVLTVALNVYLWWRGRSGHDSATYGDPSTHSAPDPESPFLPPPGAPTQDRPKVQIFFPWKAMLIGSIGLTILLNIGALLAR